MARYTTNYGNLVDTEFAPLLEALASYPIYDEEHRDELNTKIYNRFRFREIGFETAAMFTHYFQTTLGEIMPLYNELYRTADLDYDIFEDADYTTTTDASSSDSSTSSGTSSGTSRVQGKMPGASRAAMVEEYRKTIINIDARILDDLEMCFMGIY